MNKKAFEKKILDVIKDYDMIKDGDTVRVAVSGGADSVCLFVVLYNLVKDGLLDASLEIIHVEHGIRGDESLSDEAYVKSIAEKYNVPFNSFHVDVPKEVEATGESEEEAARRLRFNCFEKQGGVIALAHHKKDRAETMLINLVRGSALKGLTGIKPVRDNYIRPLLFTDRSEIEEYLNSCGIEWRTDATNLDNDYSRNKIRNAVMPLLEEINGKSEDHIVKSADYLNQVEDYLSVETEKAYKEHVSGGDGAELTLKESINLRHKLIKDRVIYEAICAVAGSKKDITNTHVELVADLFSHQGGKLLDLPYGVRALREHDGIRLYKESDSEAESDAADENLEKDFEITVKTWDKTCEISKETFKKCFDYDKIKSTVQIRRPKNSDLITIDKEGHTQNLKKFFTAARIPSVDKEKMIVVADGDEVLWVVGLRINERYKITDETKKALVIEYKNAGGKNGRED